MAEIQYVIPRGYQFIPTEEDLLSYYLPKKIEGDPLPEIEGKVLERRFYEGSPWNVLKEDDPWDDLECGSDVGKKVIYVFCKLMKSKFGKRVFRTAGCGKWLEKALGKKIMNGDKVIGVRKSFTFKPREELEWEMEGKGHWIMHEYSLPSTSSSDGYVICKITKDFPKGCVGDQVEEVVNGGKRTVSEVDECDEDDDGISHKGKKPRVIDGQEDHVEGFAADSQETIPFGEGTSEINSLAIPDDDFDSVLESLASNDYCPFTLLLDEPKQQVWDQFSQVDSMQNIEDNCYQLDDLPLITEGGFLNAHNDGQLPIGPDNYYSQDSFSNDPNLNFDIDCFLEDLIHMEEPPQQQMLSSVCQDDQQLIPIEASFGLNAIKQA